MINKTSVFWDAVPHILLEIDRCFRTVSISETSADFGGTIWHSVSEESSSSKWKDETSEHFKMIHNDELRDLYRPVATVRLMELGGFDRLGI
jgi:hypothetical protein